MARGPDVRRRRAAGDGRGDRAVPVSWPRPLPVPIGGRRLLAYLGHGAGAGGGVPPAVRGARSRDSELGRGGRYGEPGGGSPKSPQPGSQGPRDVPSGTGLRLTPGEQRAARPPGAGDKRRLRRLRGPLSARGFGCAAPRPGLRWGPERWVLTGPRAGVAVEPLPVPPSWGTRPWVTRRTFHVSFREKVSQKANFRCRFKAPETCPLACSRRRVPVMGVDTHGARAVRPRGAQATGGLWRGRGLRRRV